MLGNMLMDSYPQPKNALNLAKLLHEENNNKEVESKFSNAGGFSKKVYQDPPSNLAERKKKSETLIGKIGTILYVSWHVKRKKKFGNRVS